MENVTMYLSADPIGRAKVEKVGKLGKANRSISVNDKVKATYFNNENICRRLNNRERRRISAEKRKNRPKKKVV